MTLARSLFALLLALTSVQLAEAGPIVYFDTYRSLNVNGTVYENATTGAWAASDPRMGTIRSHFSNVGQPISAPGFYAERISTTANLNAFSSDGPMNVTTNLFTSFALDVPHTVNLNAFLSARDYGLAEGFLYNETTGVTLAQDAIMENTRRLLYQGVLGPGVYSYYLSAQIKTGDGFHQSAAEFGGALTLIAPSPVPEPATMTLLAAGLVAAWRARRKVR